MKVAGSRSCVRCGAHVPSGRALVVIEATIGGSNFLAVDDRESAIVGVMCLDEERCRARVPALRAFVAAAEKFVRKVESGRAHSLETYADLKVALALAR